ncbi:MAG TPA: AAA family ATPase [Acidobacteriaceae bacterium]|jgi:predicted ATPase|nr:AAA family ATPase [Acidobacteriaceae bacterium]
MPIALDRFNVIGLHGRRNLNVEIRENKLILVGENGTGKSTFATLVYYFLTRQWSRMRTFKFDALQATLNEQVILVTPEMIEAHSEQAERMHMVSRRFPIHYRHTLNGLMRERGLDELIEDPYLLANAADEMGMPLRVAREYLASVWKEGEGEKSELSKVNEVIASRVTEQVLFLPTYRRIEQDLKSIFRGMESDIAKLREKLALGRNSSKSIELVEFGMEDVVKAISIRMDQVKESVRTGLSSLTGTYLRDVIKGDFANVNVENLQELNRDTLNSIFARIDEETLPSYYKRRLIQKVEEIAERHTIEAGDAVVAHFLLKLFEFYRAQQESERDVREFVRVCNGYLTGKVMVYDNISYKIFISQSEIAASEIPAKGEELELRSLSSGEKQIVSLFSHIYLSDKKGVFVIIDEPELSLSVPWQRKFLTDILDTGVCNGLIAVTHSPFIWENELEQFVHSLSEFASRSDVIR